MKARYSRKASHRSDKNQLRIIGGKWRGRKLSFPTVAGLRPTGDRLRETLFNWLAPYIEGANVVDLFAGSGALGIEAASRQAGKVTLVEKNPLAARQLELNIARLAAANILLYHMDAITFLDTRPAEPFDIVFLDPPFNSALLTDSIARLQHAGLLAAGAFIYVETAIGISMPAPETWHVLRQKSAGNVCYSLYRAD